MSRTVSTQVICQVLHW